MRPLRYVALGDSLTEGVGDPVGNRNGNGIRNGNGDGNGWRGWAALLAGGLSEPSAEFTNLAVSGAQTRDVLEVQLPAALSLRPDVASVLVGVNDTLRSTFDIEKIAERLDRVYASFTRQGTALLTACLPDPGTMLGLPGVLGNPLARRQRAVNTVVHTLSERYGAVHLHAVDDPWIMDRAMWSSDRLHPGERGHRQIALRFHAMLAHRGIATRPAPSPDPEFPPPTTSASLLWLATAGTAWVVRRCNDLLPQLLCLAVDEMRHRAKGTCGRLDLRAAQAVSRALAALSAPESMRVPEQRPVPGQRSLPEGLALPGQRPVPKQQPEPEAA
ncbi:hypothetical protein ACM01_29075 [Streptomyces viridochromogenes]|uniref:SGNH hydrolase-type esterase domain-containing protein n=1 Tax=Streptomyces viridochromogenes TaxID=1938 RepID=A0A0J7Z5I8_STRVR|nr:SGNH/GDSL hydrolase family protein [Streptomyces viridochromogenes]KMS71024.1 hypothetical protein ACM01_29075 [Streptomyces viridochromogenes]KOG18565.1 hypothetical protein ADK35_21905 [Streptomyces viridochromogenes]KOG23484.1 hypothetical protein ADK36_09935 [Streptomyces viridochromogenes]